MARLPPAGGNGSSGNNRVPRTPARVAVTYLVWLLTTDLQNPLSSSRKHAMG